MEQTRIQSPSHSPSHGPQTTRSKPGGAAAAAGDTDPNAQAAGFGFLLAALDGGGEAFFPTGSEGDGVAVQDTALPLAGPESGPDGSQMLLQAGQWTQQGSGAPMLTGSEAADQTGAANLLVAARKTVSDAGEIPLLPGALRPGTVGTLSEHLTNGLLAQTARMDGLAGDGKYATADAEGTGSKTGATARKAGMGGRWGAGLGAMADAGQPGRNALLRSLAVGDAGQSSAPHTVQPAAQATASLQRTAEWGMGSAMVQGSAPTALAVGGSEVAAVNTTFAHAQGTRHQEGGAHSDQPGQAWGGASGVDGASPPATETSAEGALASFEATMADEVEMWVHQNLQKADVTVTHEGVPVDVSVDLQGNQAHVSFVSDHAQTRDLLDAGMDQLRALLQQHGLELAGMSVGSSPQRQGSGGDSPEQGRAGTGQGADGMAKESVAAVRTGIRVLTDRAVDLYA